MFWVSCVRHRKNIGEGIGQGLGFNAKNLGPTLLGLFLVVKRYALAEKCGATFGATRENGIEQTA